jgi:hypothetical protein
MDSSPDRHALARECAFLIANEGRSSANKERGGLYLLRQIVSNARLKGYPSLDSWPDASTLRYLHLILIVLNPTASPICVRVVLIRSREIPGLCREIFTESNAEAEEMAAKRSVSVGAP